MLITTYTTYDDIRAALGVSVDELADDTLGLRLYEDNLVTDLEDVHVDVPSTFATVSVLSSPTAAQTRFLTAVRTFAAYSVAKQLTVALPLFAPKEVGDGKAVMSRFNDPYKGVIKAVDEQFTRWRKRLEDAFTGLGAASASAATPRFRVMAVPPSSDPILGT